ncbi:hypothetical protein TNCV_1204281 [Trichonephila clavipes]|nr:hypothetical protein TNCV_1204281 [Trichonephila clavipes]
MVGLIKLVYRFEETGSLEDAARFGRLSLRQTRSARVAAEKETLASESAARASSARESGKRSGIHNILDTQHSLWSS